VNEAQTQKVKSSRVTRLKSCAFISIILAAQTVPCVEANEKQVRWPDGQLLYVKPDGSLTDTVKPEVMGHAALKNLKVKRMSRKEEDGGEFWIVSATAVSTNAGMANQGESVYVGFDDEFFVLMAMSNMRGEVLFRVSNFITTDGRRMLPNLKPTPGSFLRFYRLQPTE
jgi:hypothetical protein